MDPGYLCMLGQMDVFAGRGEGYGKIGNCSDIT